MENTEVIQETQQTEERTFTQAELNAIVQKRLGEQAAKFGNYEELKEKALKFDEIEDKAKSELQKATERADALQKELEGLKQAEVVRNIREKVSKETGIPATLLTGSTEEECKTQAEAIKAYAKPTYPSVRDAGEPAGQAKKGSTATQFAEWFNQSF